MTDDHQLRGVAAQLNAMSTPGTLLHTNADHNTDIRYTGEITHSKFRKRVIGKYLDRQTPSRGGYSAIVTAGAPGAGKSTAYLCPVDVDGFDGIEVESEGVVVLVEAFVFGVVHGGVAFEDRDDTSVVLLRVLVFRRH